jgi:hypothetical protein
MLDVIPGADGRLEIFGIGDDFTLQHIWQTAPSNGWSSWASHGGQLATAPCMHRNADGRLEVFACTPDSAVWHIWQTAPNNGWSGWASLGGAGQFIDAPSVGRNADGRLELFIRGSDDALWHRWQTAPSNGWSDWQSLGGSLESHAVISGSFPTVGQNADGRLEVFAQNYDASCVHDWQDAPNADWHGWNRLGGWHVYALGRGLREF